MHLIVNMIFFHFFFFPPCRTCRIMSDFRPTALNRISALFIGCLSDCRTFTRITPIRNTLAEYYQGVCVSFYICYIYGVKVRQNYSTLQYRNSASLGAFILSDCYPTKCYIRSSNPSYSSSVSSLSFITTH